ncbi:MAG: F0F1 ATP synthase subunit epsilon [Fimbriimonadales bacterium]
MSTTYDVSIVSADKTVASEVTDLVVAPGINGYFGVLANHEPFLAALKTGVLFYNDAGGKTQKIAISGGFLETDGKKVIVLADAAETATDIDINRAMAALERAKARLAQRDADVSVSRATAALERATNRLKVTGG